MKKLSIFICAALVVYLFSACSSSKEEFKEPVKFYYCQNHVSYNSEAGVISYEEQEGAIFHSNVTAFLHAYLRGPSSSELYSLIPPDVYLASCNVIDDTAYIEFSTQFSKLSGIKVTTACSAILLSLNDFIDIQTIHISARDAQIDEKTEWIFSMDEIVLIDSITIVDEEMENE